MTENHQTKNIRFRKAVSDYLSDVRTETALEKRIQRLKRLKQEIGDIFSHESISTNFEMIRNNLIRAQKHSVNLSDKSFRSFMIRQKNNFIAPLKMYPVT
jgi:predicted transcriptional regulator